jgi:hypothetical protein
MKSRAWSSPRARPASAVSHTRWVGKRALFFSQPCVLGFSLKGRLLLAALRIPIRSGYAAASALAPHRSGLADGRFGLDESLHALIPGRALKLEDRVNRVGSRRSALSTWSLLRPRQLSGFGLMFESSHEPPVVNSTCRLSSHDTL